MNNIPVFEIVMFFIAVIIVFIFVFSQFNEDIGCITGFNLYRYNSTGALESCN